LVVGAYSANDRVRDGQVHDERVPGRARAGHAGAGLQDGADVTGFPPSERDRRSSAATSRLAVGGGEGVQVGQLRSEAGVAGAGGAGDERLRGGSERAELLLGNGSRADRTHWGGRARAPP
jgi:hypothetical protein